MVAEATEETLTREGGVREHVVGAGIGCPGSIDRSRRLVRTTSNLGWVDYPIRGQIANVLQLPTVLDNDANCATYAEWWRGAGRGVEHLVGITVGTGIGGGVMLGGKIMRGASGSAGEVGHTTIDFNGRRCSCGNYGCLEAYASGPSIAVRARRGLEAGCKSVLTELVDGDLDRISAALIYKALMLEDKYAHEVMLETAKLLGIGIANIINTLNPDVVVVVGGVVGAGEHLFETIRSEAQRRSFRSAFETCDIVPGELPETAGIIGAAGIFISEIFEQL
ncbi:MAG TPA: ROK family protein [Gemmatimonadetes bacterium]|jgi:glucokinase|nr:ROK family protein [Gemmatimonadota bacterium]